MPLIAANLQSDLADAFADPGATAAACAKQWADAFGAYAEDVVPSSTAVTAAQASLESALASAFAGTSQGAAIDAAFTAAFAAIATGMAPAFVAVPPADPVGFASTVLAAPYPATHDAAATKIATAIDVCMKTGTATPSGGGPPVLWS